MEGNIEWGYNVELSAVTDQMESREKIPLMTR